LDENIDPAIADALRRKGIDVTTTVEAGLRGRDDQTQLALATSQGRVLVTHDSDFLRLAKTDSDQPGIAYCSKAALSVGEMIRSLILIHEVLTPEEISGRVEYLFS